MKINNNNINKLNYINQMLISINHNKFSLILIIFYLIISNYYINILIFLNTLFENGGELIAYAVGVKLSSIYLKISPIEPTFYFHFGLGVGPTLDLTVHQESYISPTDSNFKNYVLLTVEKVEDHIIFLKDMVPFHHKHYKTSKMTNMENNTTVISGDAPTNINVVNIHCSLESEDFFVYAFQNLDFLIFNISYIFYIICLSFYLLFLFINLFYFIKFILFIN